MSKSERSVRSSGSGGFTLVELLAVLALLLLLIALVLPAYGAVRNRTISASCQANMMALGVGMSRYIADYSQLPGINYQEGAEWARPWGETPPLDNGFFGGVQAWMPNGPNYGENSISGPSPFPSGFSGIGYVYPFVGGDGKSFYCPGTATSFEVGRTSWYNTWTGEYPSGRYEFGRQGAGTVTTYFYRSGMYDKDKRLDPHDVGWGNRENWLAVAQVPRPSDPFVQDKPVLTCFWWGYNGSFTQPNPQRITHGGQVSNLLFTGGGVRSWNLLDDQDQPVNAVWGWYDNGAYSEAEFDTYSFFGQMPYWWVKAERALSSQASQ